MPDQLTIKMPHRWVKIRVHILPFILLGSVSAKSEVKSVPVGIYELLPGRVGHVQLGIRVGALYAMYGKYRTQLINRQLAGHKDSAIEVYATEDKRGKPDVIFHLNLEADHVARAEVLSPLYKTGAGIGVGSTVGYLRSIYDAQKAQLIWRVEEGSCGFFLPARKMSFELYVNEPMGGKCNPALIPDYTLITKVLIN